MAVAVEEEVKAALGMESQQAGSSSSSSHRAWKNL